MTDDLDRINAELTRLQPLLREKVELLSNAVKEAYLSGDPIDGKQEHLSALAQDASDLSEQVNALVAEGEATLSPEVLAEIVAETSAENQEESRLKREELNAEVVPTTERVEDHLEAAVENLMPYVDAQWLSDEAEKPYRLDAAYRQDTFSMVAGRRVVNTDLHRYAHALLTATDYLEGRIDYDFHLGALFVPELAALGSKLPFLADVKGDTEERLMSLSGGASTAVESTIFELLVAAGFAKKGRKVELIPATHEKSPDIRIHDTVVPTVVECKRKQFLTDYERGEEAHVQTLFGGMHRELTRAGISGVVDVTFVVEAYEVSPVDFGDAVRRISALAHNVAVDQGWGVVRFRPLPHQGSIRATPLYSPNYLSAVFDWDYDMPDYDGIVCRVAAPDSLVTDRVVAPIGMKWRSRAKRALLAKARLFGDLLKSATDQIPTGEMGIVYLCYQEGGRPEIANERTEALIEQITGWWHRAGILIPAILMQRLYPRALEDGQPDLIENSVHFLSELADPEEYAELPSLIFAP